MSFSMMKPLPSPKEIQEKYPLSPRARKAKETRDEAIRKVITGESNQFLVIIRAPVPRIMRTRVCDYVSRLVKVQEKVAEKLILIPRIYTNKPRTTGEGYKGIVHQPDPEKKPDLAQGLIAMRPYAHPRSGGVRSFRRRRDAVSGQLELTCLISCPTWPSAPALWKISSTGLQCPASISRWA